MVLTEAIELASAFSLPGFFSDDATLTEERKRNEEAIGLLMSAWFDAPAGQEPFSFDLVRALADRNRNTCDAYGIDCITHAKKPFTKGIKECLAKYGIPACEAALVGDQIYTDTFGANNAGCMPILVRAIDNHNIWLKLRHVAELPFIFAARKRRM